MSPRRERPGSLAISSPAVIWLSLSRRCSPPAARRTLGQVRGDGGARRRSLADRFELVERGEAVLTQILLEVDRIAFLAHAIGTERRAGLEQIVVAGAPGIVLLGGFVAEAHRLRHRR